jgi:hypothetical protein
MNTFMDRVNAIVQQNQQPQNMMAAPQPEPSYPDAGMGALSSVANGAPRQTEIMGQPHMLAYINPQEEAMIQSQRGGMPAFEGPGGVPAYWFHSSSGPSFSESVSKAKDKVTSWFSGTPTTPAAPVVNNNNNDSQPVVAAPVVTTPVVTKARENKLLSGGGDDGIGNWGALGDALGGIGDALGITNYSGVTTDFGSDSENATAINTALSEANTEFEIRTLSAPGKSYDGQEYYVDANGTWQGNLPKNTITETLANWFTPLDNAKYENGQLINSSTGESLAGGGTTKNVFGFDDTIYGVADDFSNNIVDTTDMTQNQINAANLTYEDKPPSALSYAASFLPYALPGIAGEIAPFLFSNSLQSGIDSRGLNIDDHKAALLSGATPIYNEAGEYTGFDSSTREGNLEGIFDDPMSFMPPSSEGTDFTITQEDIDYINILNQQYGGANATAIGSLVDLAAGNSGVVSEYSDILAQEDGTSLKVGDVLNTGDFVNEAYKDDANNDGVDDYDRFNAVFNAQSTAAILDPFGMSTENGFITSDGTEYYIQGDGSVQEVVNGQVTYDSAESGLTVEEVIEKVIVEPVFGTTCPEGYSYDEGKGSCVRDTVIEVPPNTECPTGYSYDDSTSSCVKDTDIIDNPTSEDDNSVSTTTVVTTTVDELADQLYNRYYKGGSGKFLPDWLQRYVSGTTLDQLLSKVTVDGKDYYKTPDGKYIEASELIGAANLGPELTLEEKTGNQTETVTTTQTTEEEPEG